jgi:ubiquinone/menaquinone biosynthesis C-methylase UbiE
MNAARRTQPVGADVAGLDASDNLVALARERLPGAPIEIGEMEALPFADECFDVVTGINAFQFAGDMVRALSEARRVCRTGGTVFLLAWGAREDCELMSIAMAPMLALLPRHRRPRRGRDRRARCSSQVWPKRRCAMLGWSRSAAASSPPTSCTPTQTPPCAR